MYWRLLSNLCIISIVCTAEFSWSMKAISTSGFKSETKALTKWPSYLYGEAFPGAAFPKPITDRELTEYQQRAFRVTLEEAEKKTLDESIRVQLDWAYALMKSENTLLLKPIEKWSVDDISLLSSWINRLTAKNPGEFRSEGVLWNLKEFSLEEVHRLKALEAKAGNELTQEEIDFCNSCYYTFMPYTHVKQSLSNLLEIIRQEMESVQLLPTEERMHRFIGVGALIHFEIVKIHPYQEGAKRLGRLMMYIAWCQKGIEPVVFFENIYGDKLIEALTKHHSVFFNYVAGRYYVCKLLRTLPFYHEVLSDIGKKLGSEKANFKDEFFKHPLYQAYIAKQSRLLAVGRDSSSNALISAKSCYYCQKSSAHAEDIKRCSRCKNAFYCSIDCQKADWKKRHHGECVKKE